MSMRCPKVFTVPDEFLPGMKGAKKTGGDFNESEVAERTDKPKLVGAIVPHWQKHARGRQTVCFAVNRAHGGRIYEAFKAAGVAAEYLDGETPLNVRAAMLDRLANGKVKVVVNVGVLTEGWDCPPVKCLVMARPTASLTLYLQMAGRIHRSWLSRGKLVDPIILDHAGNALRFGLPQDPRDHAIDAKPAKPRRTCKRCKPCGATVAMNEVVCPECGEAFGDGGSTIDNPLFEADGELVEATQVQPWPRSCLGFGGEPCPKNGWYTRHSKIGVCASCAARWRKIHSSTEERERLSASMRRVHSTRTPEQRSEIVRKAKASMTPEQRKNAGRLAARHAPPMSNEDKDKKRAVLDKVRSAMSAEQKSDAAKKAAASRPADERSASLRKANAARTFQNRSDGAIKAWVTRRTRDTNV